MLRKTIRILLLITALAACSTEYENEYIESPDLGAEALHLVELIEATHPIFIITPSLLPQNYQAIRAEFLDHASQTDCVTQFAFAGQRFFTALQDGHMAQRWLGNTGYFIYVDWDVRDDRLFLSEGAEITAIGGVPIPDVFAQVDRHYFSENKFDRAINLTINSRDKEILRIAGAELADHHTTLTLLVDGEHSTKEVGFTHTNRWVFADVDFDQQYIIRYEWLDDIFYISLRQFTHHPTVYDVITAIREAALNGTDKFIVDVRGNGGGNSMVGTMLLNAMGITQPAWGTHRRYSDLAREQRPMMRSDTDSSISIRSPWATNANNVFVSVLTDNFSYSAATMFAATVQDGGLGNVVGEPSRNAPTSFGDMLHYHLPVSGLDIFISYTKFFRPDVNADQNILWPDVMVPADAALDAAVQFLNNLEV